MTTNLNKTSDKLTAQLYNHKRTIDVDELSADEALSLAKEIQKEDLNQLDKVLIQLNDCK